MEDNRKNIMWFKWLRSLSVILLIAFGFVTIIASGGDDDDDAPEDVETYSIQGTVTLAGEALADVTVAVTGASTDSTITDENGSFTLSNLENGDYTVTPAPLGYTFDPVNISVTIDGADVTGIGFIAQKSFGAAKFLHYALPDQYTYQENGGLVEDEAEALFTGYTLTEGIDYGGDVFVSGYALDQFVNEDKVAALTPDPEGLLEDLDSRELYTVIVRSHLSDGGFSIRSKFVTDGLFEPDLRWDLFTTGYLLDLNYSGKTYFPSNDIIKRHDIKYSNDIYMFRKIDVVRPDEEGSIATFEVQATTDNYVDDTEFTAYTQDPEYEPEPITGGLTTTKFTVEMLGYESLTDVKAISLDQFITDYVTDNPDAYTYDIVGLDGSIQEEWTYEEMQQAYYLLDFDLVIQFDTSDEPIIDTKINFPVRIEVISDSSVEYDYAATDPPAYAYAYEEIIPEEE